MAADSRGGGENIDDRDRTGGIVGVVAGGPLDTGTGDLVDSTEEEAVVVGVVVRAAEAPHRSRSALLEDQDQDEDEDERDEGAQDEAGHAVATWSSLPTPSSEGASSGDDDSDDEIEIVEEYDAIDIDVTVGDAHVYVQDDAPVETLVSRDHGVGSVGMTSKSAANTTTPTTTTTTMEVAITVLSLHGLVVETLKRKGKKKKRTAAARPDTATIVASVSQRLGGREFWTHVPSLPIRLRSSSSSSSSSSLSLSSSSPYTANDGVNDVPLVVCWPSMLDARSSSYSSHDRGDRFLGASPSTLTLRLWRPAGIEGQGEEDDGGSRTFAVCLSVMCNGGGMVPLGRIDVPMDSDEGGWGGDRSIPVAPLACVGKEKMGSRRKTTMRTTRRMSPKGVGGGVNGASIGIKDRVRKLRRNMKDNIGKKGHRVVANGNKENKAGALEEPSSPRSNGLLGAGRGADGKASSSAPTVTMKGGSSRYGFRWAENATLRVLMSVSPDSDDGNGDGGRSWNRATPTPMPLAERPPAMSLLPPMNVQVASIGRGGDSGVNCACTWNLSVTHEIEEEQEEKEQEGDEDYFEKKAEEEYGEKDAAVFNSATLTKCAVNFDCDGNNEEIDGNNSDCNDENDAESERGLSYAENEDIEKIWEDENYHEGGAVLSNDDDKSEEFNGGEVLDELLPIHQHDRLAQFSLGHGRNSNIDSDDESKSSSGDVKVVEDEGKELDENDVAKMQPRNIAVVSSFPVSSINAISSAITLKSLKAIDDKLCERQQHMLPGQQPEAKTETPIIILEGGNYQVELEKNSMLRVSDSVSNSFINREQSQSPEDDDQSMECPSHIKLCDHHTRDNNDDEDSLLSHEEEDDYRTYILQENDEHCDHHTSDNNDDDDSLLSIEEEDDYRTYILKENEVRTLRQQLLDCTHANTELQMELDDANHALDNKVRMVASLHGENEALRAELEQTKNNAESLLNELNSSKAVSEMLPFFESRVNELLDELKKRDFEVLCLREELDELRGHYKEQLSVEGLLWDHNDDHGYDDDTNNSCDICGDDNGGAVQERVSVGLSSAAASSFYFGRKLAKVIEEKVVTRELKDDNYVNFQDDHGKADASFKSPFKRENCDPDSISDVGGMKKASEPLLPLLLPEWTGNNDDGNDNDKISEEKRVSSLDEEMTRTKAAVVDNESTKRGVGGGSGGGVWGVRRLGVSLMTMEEKMRERQQLFREQQQRALAEQQRQAELERLNAAPGLGGVLMSRISSKSGHAERQKTKEHGYVGSGTILESAEQDLKTEYVEIDKTRDLIPAFAVETSIEGNESAALGSSLPISLNSSNE